MRQADGFDTYYGELSTVANNLPSPAAGQGLYYVTAVNSEGRTRWGRQSIGGALSGRDPDALPRCSK